MFSARIACFRARRKSYYHVPRLVQQRYYVLLQVPFRMAAAAGFQIAGICLMAQPSQFDCHRLAFLTRNQYSHPFASGRGWPVIVQI